MIVVLLDAMETHLDDSTMMRNGCLTLCQFRIPQDVVSGREQKNVKLVLAYFCLDNYWELSFHLSFNIFVLREFKNIILQFDDSILKLFSFQGFYVI